MPLNLEGDEAEDENPEEHSAEIQQDTDSGVVKFGVIWMAREEILENVMGALNGVVEIPRKWTGLQPLIST
ncbi:hypothetical protein POTOM_050854 [Populus tomentosa]|uniref:Uncharacterized protein n=1 Tax=Populus tomentosa TaxID=118781 RepID=A0A8X8C8F0_POPTO|nr:hypothetical protein POTOM_050854 [Populus tomentosa]